MEVDHKNKQVMMDQMDQMELVDQMLMDQVEYEYIIF